MCNLWDFYKERKEFKLHSLDLKYWNLSKKKKKKKKNDVCPNNIKFNIV